MALEDGFSSHGGLWCVADASTFAVHLALGMQHNAHHVPRPPEAGRPAVQRAVLPQVCGEGGGAKPHKLVGARQDEEVQQRQLLRVQACGQRGVGRGGVEWVA